MATGQFIGTVPQYVIMLHESEVRIPNTCNYTEIKARYGLFFHKQATLLLKVPSTGKNYIAVKASWITRYVRSSIGMVHDCLIVSVENKFASILLHGRIDTTYADNIIHRPIIPENLEGHSDE